jgi:hypothetical protein
MAAPTPTTNLYTNGRGFVATWSGVWAGTGELTDSIVVNVSDLAQGNRARIYSISLTATAGISALLEFDDASSDVIIYRHPIGVVGNIVLDFTHIDGLIWEDMVGGTDTGDIILTTDSAAAADEISIVVVGRSS